MKSKAAIGSHPIHPLLVPIPIGAFFLALVGDVMRMATPEDRFWYDFPSPASARHRVRGSRGHRRRHRLSASR
jgi:hypothetical protein